MYVLYVYIHPYVYHIHKYTHLYVYSKTIHFLRIYNVVYYKRHFKKDLSLKCIQRHYSAYDFYTSRFSLIHSLFSKLRNESDPAILPFKKKIIQVYPVQSTVHILCIKNNYYKWKKFLFTKWDDPKWCRHILRQMAVFHVKYNKANFFLSYRDAVIDVIRSAVQFTDWQVLTVESVSVCVFICTVSQTADWSLLTFLWCILWCLTSSSERANFFWQLGQRHVNGFSPENHHRGNTFYWCAVIKAMHMQ